MRLILNEAFARHKGYGINQFTDSYDDSYFVVDGDNEHTFNTIENAKKAIDNLVKFYKEIDPKHKVRQDTAMEYLINHQNIIDNASKNKDILHKIAQVFTSNGVKMSEDDLLNRLMEIKNSKDSHIQNLLYVLEGISGGVIAVLEDMHNKGEISDTQRMKIEDRFQESSILAIRNLPPELNKDGFMDAFQTPKMRTKWERDNFPYYVSVYIHDAAYEPAEGGYYVDTAQMNTSNTKGFDHLSEARKYAKKLFDKYEYDYPYVESESRDYYARRENRQRYIGDLVEIIVEKNKDFGSGEFGYAGYN